MANVELIEMSDDQIQALIDSQRTRGGWLSDLTEFAADKNKRVLKSTLSENDTSVANHVSGFKRAADKLKLKVNVIGNKDENTVHVIKVA
jgi:hypothetical protein